MNYKIVSADSTNELETKVNAMLQEGWELFGDPFVSDEYHPPFAGPGSSGRIRPAFHQALIKHDKTI